MATYTVQVPTAAGITPSNTAVSSSDTFAVASGHAYLLHVINGGGSSCTVTVDDPNSTDPGAATSFNPDQAITVPAGQQRMAKLNPARMKNATTGLCTIAYSFTTSVTAAVYLVEN